MNTETFAVWKFKCIEGILKNFMPYDFFSTKYKNGEESFFITYDVKSLKATIKPIKGHFTETTCSFKDLVDTLKKMGVYEMMDEKDIHKSALIPFEGRLDV